MSGCLKGSVTTHIPLKEGFHGSASVQRRRMAKRRATTHLDIFMPGNRIPPPTLPHESKSEEGEGNISGHKYSADTRRDVGKCITDTAENKVFKKRLFPRAKVPGRPEISYYSGIGQSKR